MRRKHRHMLVESLEQRNLLAATADIVFLIDESGSQAHDGDGNAVRPWVSLVVEQLETKLVSRGIGSDEGQENRYGVVAFGEGRPEQDDDARARILRTDGSTGDLFAEAEDFDDFFAATPVNGGFASSGDREDGWEATLAALGIEGYSSVYEFRPEAAVHFIIVSDEVRSIASESGEIYANLGGMAPVSNVPLLFEVLDELRHENVTTEDEELEVLNDVVVTVVAPFYFAQDAFGADQTYEYDYAETVLGVDVHRLDEINVDLNSSNPSQDEQTSQPDEYIVFKWQDWQTLDPEADNAVVADDNGGAEILMGTLSQQAVDYQDIRDLFNTPCDGDPNVACFDQQGYPEDDIPSGYWNPFLAPDLQELGQATFDAEEYAFLAWEARGTAWDFRLIQDSFGTWVGNDQNVTANRENFTGFGDENSRFSMLNRAFVDDTFEKIKLQIADFDQSGRITGADIDAALQFWYNYAPANQTSQQKAWFDLDGSGTIDDDDVIKLIDEVLMLWIGDANADGLFNSDDWTQVFIAGEYEDETEDNSTWSEGDWNFDNDADSNDFVAAYVAGGYEIGYKDGMLPIWGAGMTSGVYFVAWD